MECKTIHKELIFFLEGDLPSEKAGQIEMHLNECSACAAFAEEMKETLGILEAEKSPAVNPFFYTQLKAKLENRESAEPAFFKRVVLAQVLQPALFSILLIIGIYSGIKIGQPSPVKVFSTTQFKQDAVPYFNEMKTESIETFLME
jgi:anti-sigma factor RsiW